VAVEKRREERERERERVRVIGTRKNSFYVADQQEA
jgi:hypothetical protein